MKTKFKTPDYDWLEENYFSDEKQVATLRKGNALLPQGQYNDRLHLVKKGLLIVYAEDSNNNRYEVFRANPRMFIGDYSYFSKTCSSITTVVAEKNSEFAFIDHSQSVQGIFKTEYCESTEEAGGLIEEIDEKGEDLVLIICNHIMSGTNGIIFLLRNRGKVNA